MNFLLQMAHFGRVEAVCAEWIYSLVVASSNRREMAYFQGVCAKKGVPTAAHMEWSSAPEWGYQESHWKLIRKFRLNCGQVLSNATDSVYRAAYNVLGIKVSYDD